MMFNLIWWDGVWDCYFMPPICFRDDPYGYVAYEWDSRDWYELL